MNSKPRNSILYMFDPLESVCTPRREGSPDSGSSDKENDTQPGEVTMFFNRVYTLQKRNAPKTSSGKLIDIDDTTDDTRLSENEDDKDDAIPSTDSSSLAKMLDSRIAVRIPLADISIEETAESLETQAEQANTSVDEDDSTPARVVTAAPTGAPLADVINSINLASLSISGSAPSSPLAGRSPLVTMTEETEDSDEEGDVRLTEGEVEDTVSIPLLITVSSPAGTYEESNSLTDVDLPPISESPTDRLFASSANILPATRRPPLKHHIANDDPRRASVDLHASFSMQMQSAEMSFDLLNDKISFQAADSMWTGGDDDDEEFDMAAELENMEVAARECERAEQDKLRCESQTRVPAGAASPVSADENESTMAQQAVPEVAAPAPVAVAPPRVFGVFSSSTSRESHRPEPPCPINIMPATTTYPSPSHEAIIPVAPIPALRIVKKTWKVHGRTESATSAGSFTSSSSVAATSTRATSPALSTESDTAASTNEGVKSLAVNAVAPAQPRTVIRGVQRPPAGSEITPAGVVVPAASAPHRRPAGERSRESLAREASARFAAAGVQRPNLQQGQRVMQLQTQKVLPAPVAAKAQKRATAASATTNTVPRSVSAGRLAAGASATAKPTGAGVAGGAGALKALGGIGIPKAKSTSALPRPASRLPAPAAGASFKLKPSGSGTKTSGWKRPF